MFLTFSIIAVIFVAIVIYRSIIIIPQQKAYIIEWLGKFYSKEEAGLKFLIPFFDKVAYVHSLKEVPLDVPSQICITKDNTQLTIDGVLYFQVTDAKLASYGSSNYILAITQLAQTTLRSVIGKMELDKTFEERDDINKRVIEVLDDAAISWGVKVLRYEIKDLTPPEKILQSMQRQITAEREKRAVIAESEGKKIEQINLAEGQRQAQVKRSEGERDTLINIATGQSQSILLNANAEAEANKIIGDSLSSDNGQKAMQYKLANHYVDSLNNMVGKSNTVVIPNNLSDSTSFLTTAMSVLNGVKNNNQ